MNDEIPSPAGTGPPAPPPHDGPVRLPWESALYDAVRALEQRAREAERERDRLILRVHKLEGQLRECRTRLENWKLRREAWRRERAELLRRGFS